ncbi:hypothetical protein A2635_01865 [Candidatus Peribacteria bacterium RIFCSPHIGHO2_01_FULL_51_9]|nr:MAG: hypothetical protein A2635_01865 [Candidatus Peribacteria bacterium RIFCSPHIGHO2_01_FULL_51_9]
MARNVFLAGGQLPIVPFGISVEESREQSSGDEVATDDPGWSEEYSASSWNISQGDQCPQENSSSNA